MATLKSAWETINIASQETTDRMKIPGGYLYRTLNQAFRPYSVAMVFVPNGFGD